MEASEITEIISAINQSGGIPVQMHMVSEQNWEQFGLMLFIAALGSIIMVYYVYLAAKPFIGAVLSWIKLYRIKSLMGRNILLVKHTEQGLFSSSMIDPETMYKVEKALKKFDGKPFDLILHTPGGYVFHSQLLSTILKKYPGQIRALVPFYAMSGGTFLALSCDEIHMGDTACLGPVDPQLGTIFTSGSAKSYKEVVRRKGRRASDASIQMAYIGQQYSRTMERMFGELLRDKIADEQKLSEAVQFFTAGDVEHAYPITRQELETLGVMTKPLDLQVRKYMVDIVNSKIIEGVYHI